MRVADDMKQKVQKLLIQDPLFAVIRDTPEEDILYNDSYLPEIIEKKFYSTPEVAGWFEISDAQLRYYIKPFQEYIFPIQEETPSTPSVIRLTFTSILKLRMIMLLKDEYRVKGLKRLLGIDENGQILKHRTTATLTEVAAPDDLAKKVEVLSNVLQQMMQTGLFEMQQDGDSSTVQIAINQDYLAQNIKLFSSESTKQIAEIHESTEKIKDENATLRKQIQELQKDNIKDIAVKIKERHIENEVISALRAEAIQLFVNEKKYGIFEKFFHSSQIEIEKEQFVVDFVQSHLADRLEEGLRRYYGE